MRAVAVGVAALVAVATTCLATGAVAAPAAAADPTRVAGIGRVDIATVPVPANVILRSATYTPSGHILVSYAEQAGDPRDMIRLATMDDDGSHWRPFFAQTVATRPKANGIRFMVFADDRRIMTGDYVIECRTTLATCTQPELLPVTYPAEIADGPAVLNRWSEIIVAPDNRHFSWDTLIARSAMVFTGALVRHGDRYDVEQPQIVSTLDPFRADPQHPGMTLAGQNRGGEVKQFVRGGTAISVVGIDRRNLPGSAIVDLLSERREMITNPPAYTETTIFSPDERLGLTMSTRFSATSNPGVFGLVPTPHADSLNISLAGLAYTYAVTGVRLGRPGAVGPVLIDIAAARANPAYLGTNLSRDADWIFYSPMSWHPNGRRGLWIEGQTDAIRRIRRVVLPDYRPGRTVAARSTPDRSPGATTDMAAVGRFVQHGYAADVRVAGLRSGYITFRRSATGDIEKRYVDYSDDGRTTYAGVETMQFDPRATSRYTADLRVTGAHRGAVQLRVNFGPMGGAAPARLIFAAGADGRPQTAGFAEYDGRRMSVDSLQP